MWYQLVFYKTEHQTLGLQTLVLYTRRIQYSVSLSLISVSVSANLTLIIRSSNMAIVPTELHLTCLMLVILLWIISAQQICVSSTKEKQQFIYRLLTFAYAFNEVIVAAGCSSYYDSGIFIFSFHTCLCSLLL